MLLLAIDTSTPICSVAILNDSKIFFENSKKTNSHSEELMSLIDLVMSKSGACYKDLQYIAFNVGPGSFTGIRCGMSAAFGIAAPQALKEVSLLPIGVSELCSFSISNIANAMFKLYSLPAPKLTVLGDHSIKVKFREGFCCRQSFTCKLKPISPLNLCHDSACAVQYKADSRIMAIFALYKLANSIPFLPLDPIYLDSRSYKPYKAVV